MDFISNKEKQNQEMLQAIGVQSIEALFSAIPKQLFLKKPLQDDGLSEYEGLRLMEALAKKNAFSSFENYLGAGSYEHHVPALVGAITSRSEFLTSYTPYQPEASQGMLQIIFEFQSAICALTSLDVANASVYDGASACAEAMLMALRHHKERNQIVVAGSLHPHYRAVVEQYLVSHQTEILEIPFLANGLLDLAKAKELINHETASVLVSYPNFFGGIDPLREISALAKSVSALTVISANPLIYGLYSSAAELGADIAVGDCQTLGLPLQYGGPYAGYMACRSFLMRQLPGRIAGETVDTKGRRGFVLTLQAREQHIRREKATSNICTNQALAALASLVTILWYGKNGLKQLALTNFQRANYLRAQLGKNGIQVWQGNIFNEFVAVFKRPIQEVLESFRKEGIEPGIALNHFYPHLEHHLLIAVTETKTQEQLDRFVAIARRLA